VKRTEYCASNSETVAFESFEALGVLLHVRHWDLMCSPESLQPVPTHLRRRGPSFWSAHDDHRPAWTLRETGLTCLLLNPLDIEHAVLDSRGHRLMHAVGVRTFHEVRCPAIAAEQVLQFPVTDARQQRGIVDLVTVEMEDRQDHSITNRVQELIDVPRSCEWARF